MHLMNSRERLRRCYYHEELDRPGVYIRTYWPKNDPTYDTVRNYVAELTDLKLRWPIECLECAPPGESRRESFSADFEREIHTVHTPAGDLQSSTLIGLRGNSNMHDSYLLKDAADARKWMSLPMPQLSNDVSSYFEMDRRVGDRGIVDADIGHNPAGTVAALFGSETFAIMTLTERDLIHELCRRQMEIILARLKNAIRLGVGPFFSMLGEEYLVPPLHGPVDFCDFNVRYDKPIIDLVHEAGGRIHIHSHGRIGRVFQSFVDMGVDVLHPVEPPLMGDITAKQAKSMARGKLCIEGNLQVANFYEHTAGQIRDEVRTLIDDAFDDHRGLIVAPSASLYQFGKGQQCCDQVRAMIETVCAY